MGIPQSHTADQPKYHEEEPQSIYSNKTSERLEDLKVLRRSPDLLNNVKIGQG